MFFYNHIPEISETNENSESRRLVIAEDDCLRIDDFLNESAYLEVNNSAVPYIQSAALSTQLAQLEATQTIKKVNKPLKKTKKNSLFHNFQKHLITLIKKLVLINDETFLKEENPQLPLLLWSTFLKAKIHSKKILNIIFGAQNQNRFEEDTQKLGQHFQQFKTIREIYTEEEISDAQCLLRTKAVETIEQSGRERVQGKCHVKKFDEFYLYLKNFVVELKEGPVTERMTKVSKSNVLKKLKEQTC